MHTQRTLTWSSVLADEKKQPYFQNILDFLSKQRKQGKIIYPQQSEIFNALKLTPFANIKVVIIGQDPYHGPDQAHGLCFSVNHGVATPPSLQNIYKELHSDLGLPIPNHGCLTPWAKQGVLLLNAVLTVQERTPQSHAHIGWQTFTDKIISSLNQHPQGIVFLLWGSYAQKKAELIDTSKHKILMTTHPSPFSAHRGFLGCQHFSKTNQGLMAMGREPVDWELSGDDSL